MFTIALFRNYVPNKQILWRNFTSHPYPPGHAFTFFPQFFSKKEQRLLLSASLKILDSSDTRLTRRRRAEFFKSKLPQSNDTNPMELFAPDNLYHFQEVSLKALKSRLYIF
jgi:Rad3-related DNA helicase